MPNCPKCGADVEEGMAFCPKCGAALKPAEEADWRQEMRQRRREWREQRRKWRDDRRATRRGEKSEKTEKHEHPFIGTLIAGSILILLGVLVYYASTSTLTSDLAGAYFFITVGIIVLAIAVYAAMLATRRHPRTQNKVRLQQNKNLLADQINPGRGQDEKVKENARPESRICCGPQLCHSRD